MDPDVTVTTTSSWRCRRPSTSPAVSTVTGRLRGSRPSSAHGLVQAVDRFGTSRGAPFLVFGGPRDHGRSLSAFPNAGLPNTYPRVFEAVGWSATRWGWGLAWIGGGMCGCRRRCDGGLRSSGDAVLLVALPEVDFGGASGPQTFEQGLTLACQSPPGNRRNIHRLRPAAIPPPERVGRNRRGCEPKRWRAPSPSRWVLRRCGGCAATVLWRLCLGGSVVGGSYTLVAGLTSIRGNVAGETRRRVAPSSVLDQRPARYPEEASRSGTRLVPDSAEQISRVCRDRVLAGADARRERGNV